MLPQFTLHTFPSRSSSDAADVCLCWPSVDSFSPTPPTSLADESSWALCGQLFLWLAEAGGLPLPLFSPVAVAPEPGGRPGGRLAFSEEALASLWRGVGADEEDEEGAEEGDGEEEDGVGAEPNLPCAFWADLGGRPRGFFSGVAGADDVTGHTNKQTDRPRNLNNVE